MLCGSTCGRPIGSVCHRKITKHHLRHTPLLNSTMPTTTTTTTTEQIYTTVQQAVTQVKQSLDTLQATVLESESVSAAFEQTNALVETASALAQTALTSVRDNVPASTSEALAKITLVLEEVKKLSAEKYSFSLNSANQALVKALQVVTTWTTVVYEFALQRVSSLDSTFQLSSKTVEWATIASEHTKLLDTKYGIAAKAWALNDSVKEFDEFYSVQEKTLGAAKKCQEIGDRLTGSRLTPLVDYVTTFATQSYTTGVEGYNLVTDSVVTKAAEQNSTLSLETKGEVDVTKTEQ